MKSSAPAQAAEALQCLTRSSKGSEHRDFTKFVTLVTTWSRERELSDIQDNVVCDYLEYKAHWKGRGRDSPAADRKWVKATKPKKFKSGKAWYEGKKLLVKAPCQRRFRNADKIRKTLTGPSSELMTAAG